MTRTLTLDPEGPQPELIEQAAAVIRAGGLVAFPTETVYGLGADALSESAVARIFAAKGRPADNPLIVHVCDRAMLAAVAAEVGPRAEVLIERFWPGPLTLVLERRPELPPAVSAGLPTVAVRMPGNPIALALIRAAGLPVAAPSANLSGRPSPTSAAHVAADLAGRVEMILDGGPTHIGIESTVLDMTADPPLILRPGWVTEEDLARAIGPVGRAAAGPELRRSPGTRYRHYSPQARVVLVAGGPPERLREICVEHLKHGPVGFIGHSGVDIPDARFHRVKLRQSPQDYAQSIYAALRALDAKQVEVIVVEGIGEAGGGAAVMDRLRRAASEIVTGQGRGL